MLKQFLLMVVGAVSLTTCGCACSRTGIREPRPKAVTLTESDAGKTIRIARKGTVTLCLHGNGTTGFGWEAVTVSGLHQKGEPDRVPDNFAMGAGATYRYLFEAVESGPATLKMAYRRPWERELAPLKSFEIVVFVEE